MTIPSVEIDHSSLWTGKLRVLMALQGDLPELRESEEEHWVRARCDAQEAQLAEAVAESPDSFLLLYERYYKPILNYLYRRTFDHDLAQDLTSRTFLQAFEHLRSCPRQVPFRPWIYRVATNAHISHGRSWGAWRRRLESCAGFLSASPPPQPDAVLLRRSAGEQVRTALARLSEKDRTPLLLRYYEELSYRDIAVVLGISEVGARSRVSRALERLQLLVRAREDEE